ncbi:hypothetical protein EJ02DRAFT_343930 [Clathrospora elynae]|uniref:Uncharacterized protein n=1 Tax=Clathrospora elynae TaxID=706981 RepID=A0A6A5SX39_9PLEO|nr:hypothetical protein EJ02DRAFT_343930 [Clathrospora elynae]
MVQASKERRRGQDFRRHLSVRIIEVLSFHGPAQATAPPLCWSKPSRTPADSDRWPADRVWLR